MKEVIIIGSGAVAAEISSYLEDVNKMQAAEEIKIIGFLDDNPDNFAVNADKYKFVEPYLGATNSFDFSTNENYILGFANIQSRKNLLSNLIHLSLNFLTVIHPTVQIAKTAQIGPGTVIYPNCVIGPNVKIGAHNLITSYSFISHDCIVGDNNFFSTSGLSGDVRVGNNNFFGIRATVLPGINIGSLNTIQAGMTLDKDVSDQETVFYRYKEKIHFVKNPN